MKKINLKAKKLVKLMKEVEKLKSLYSKIDELTDDLSSSPLTEIKLDSKKSLFITDNFHSKNKVFVTTSAKRFSVEIKSL